MPAVIGTALVVVLLALGAADYWFMERPHQAPVISSSASSTSSSAISSQAPVRKGVQKKSQTSVEETLQNLGMMLQETQEQSVLQRITPPSATVQTRVLLKDNDRAALFSWIDSPDAKTLFFGIKQSLVKSLSPQATNVMDTTVEPEDGPPYDLLSFTDPTISPEQLVFVRVRTRIYAMQISQGQEAAMRQVLDALTK